MSGDDYPRHREAFDAVLVKVGKTEFDAEPGDIKRVQCTAESTLHVRQDADIEKVCTEEGYYVADVVTPGYVSHLESQASRRAVEAAVGAVDPRQF